MLFAQTPRVRFLSLVFVVIVSVPALAAVDSHASTGNERFKTLLDYASIANAAYQRSDKIETALTDAGYTLTQHGQLPGYGVSYFLATNDQLKQQILAVRGTSNIENAMVDVAIKLLPNEHTGIKLHQGFAQSADFIYDKLKPHLNKDYRINTTGHSLGGATALIFAMHLDADGFNVGKVITFGQPKVTNVSGSRKYRHLDVTRVVMPKDMVPLVPPLDPMDITNVNIYWHLGTEVVLQQANTYSELEGINSMLRATDFLNENISEKNLQQHYMSLYIKSLSQKQANPERVPYVNDFSINDWFGSKKARTQ